MKSRDLLTTPVVIVTGYTLTSLPNGKYRHQFTPQSTSTLYQFDGNAERVLSEGARYNIGYRVENGANIVDMAATAKADNVDPAVSYYVAVQLGAQNAPINTAKSDSRVIHRGTGKHLGKKYAWRIYGMVVVRKTFDEYLEKIGHPTVVCTTDGSPSIAYLDSGIDVAMRNLMASLVHVSGNRYRSPLLPDRKWFNIKGITAITEKK
ncbi:MAG TPA: hypothetical protein VF800_30580 [Telluria sp.]|jgi:hypothetical protein